MNAWICFLVTLVGSGVLFAGLAVSILGIDLQIEAVGSLAGLDPNGIASAGLVFIGAVIQWIGVAKI